MDVLTDTDVSESAGEVDETVGAVVSDRLMKFQVCSVDNPLSAKSFTEVVKVAVQLSDKLISTEGVKVAVVLVLLSTVVITPEIKLPEIFLYKKQSQQDYCNQVCH